MLRSREHTTQYGLAGQTLYATVSITQGAQTREVDMRLSEALALAVRDHLVT